MFWKTRKEDGEPQIIRKLARYYGYYNCDRRFRKFHVVVIVQTESRRRNLLKHLSESFNHPMFWVSTAETPFEFLTPKDQRVASLFSR